MFHKFAYLRELCGITLAFSGLLVIIACVAVKPQTSQQKTCFNTDFSSVVKPAAVGHILVCRKLFSDRIKSISG